jgi:hypothetical protein
MPLSRGAALLLTGLWLGFLFASWAAASASFRAVDRVLGPGQRPELASKLGAVAPEDRRTLLRHLASEINRSLFRRWAILQLLLATALLAAAWSAGVPTRVLVGAALAIALAQSIALGPSIETLGRSIDFVARPLPPDVARRFGALHASFVVLDLGKAGLLVAAGFLLARRTLP